MKMQTIGDQSLASKIYAKMQDNTGIHYPRAPHGFKRIGDGAYRVAYLHKPTQVVYKHGSSWANKKEADNAARLISKGRKRLPFTLVIPQTTLLPGFDNTMIAQEFAVGAKPTFCRRFDAWRTAPCSCKHTPCFVECFNRIEDWSDIFDIHYYNVLVDPQDRLWLVDLGG